MLKTLSIFSRIKRQQISFFSTFKNPYDTLGVKQSATAQQIKKAYRIIAQKYHPDKNPDQAAQKIFIEAKQAYETLIDEDKRRQYDNQHTSTSRSHGFDRNPFDEFSDDIFKDKSRTHHETFTSGSSRRKKGDNITREIGIDFIQSVKGVEMSLNLERKATCSTCAGNKCKPGTAPSRCLSCGGSGSTIFRRGGIVMHLQCQRCKGIGLIIKYPCLDCKTTGITSQKVVEKVTIPPGVQNGQTITLAEKGDQSDNGPGGDLIIKINVQKHPKFRKQGEDIHSTQWMTISQAVLGSKLSVDTVWGKREIKVSEGSPDGLQITIKGQGVQLIRDKGNHIVTMRVKIPTKLNDQQKKIFEQLSQLQQPIKEEQQPILNKDSQGVFERMKKAFR